VRRRRTSVLRALIWLALILLASCGTAVWMVLSVPPEPEDLEPPAVVQARSAKVREILDAGRQKQAASEVQPRRAVLSEADLNAFLATDPGAVRRLSEKNVKRVRVRLGDGRVRVSSLVHVRGRDVSVAAEGALTAGDEGQVVFHPAKVRVGRLWMPASVAAHLSGQDPSFGREIVYEAPADITRLQVRDGKLEVEWVPAGG